MPRVALAVIHGIGSQDPGYADSFMGRVRARFAARLRISPSRAAERLSARVLVLSGILRSAEREVLARMPRHHPLGWRRLREFVAEYVGDAIGYQRTERADIYRATHSLVAEELNRLDAEAGPGSLFAIAAHSLGTVIACNYIWDIEREIVPPQVLPLLSTPTSRLANLTHLYTLGSPLALYSLRFPAFGRPIRFPVNPRPEIKGCEWVNFFDDDDVVAYPLRGLSEDYARAVTRDRMVQVGGWLARWNPLSHTGYWSSRTVADHIASRLARDWQELNPP